MNTYIEKKDLKYWEKISLKQLQEEIKSIKRDLPQEKQNIITYSKNFTISLSNYCRNYCKYCYYNHRIPKGSQNENTVLLKLEEIIEQLKKGKKFDCKEALIISGEQPNKFPEVQVELNEFNFISYIQYVKSVCKLAIEHNILPHINIGVMDYTELRQLKKFNASMGLMLESTDKTLLEEGGVHEHSPGKKPEIRVEHLRNAGKLKIPFTTGLLLGIGESFENRVKDLYIIKEIHETYGHIQEVIIQNFEYKKGVEYNPNNKISMKEMLRITGIAKLIFQNEIAVQVPPNLVRGYEEEFLAMGIDDFGGISPYSQDFINPENEWPNINQLEKICKDGGYTLKERLPIYEDFINKPGFCSDAIKNVIQTIKI